MIGQQKKLKVDLLHMLEQIDKEAESSTLTSEEWQQCYEIEGSLEQIYQMEEVYWQQRVGDWWTIKGDSNTEFFHRYANGRRRKSTIVSLEGDQGTIKGQEEIAKHIVNFYKNLFGPNPDRIISLSSSFWQSHFQLSETQKEDLIKPFMEVEIKEAIFDMKSESAPGPNGFGVTFFKRFWEVIKGDYIRVA